MFDLFFLLVFLRKLDGASDRWTKPCKKKDFQSSNQTPPLLSIKKKKKKKKRGIMDMIRTTKLVCVCVCARKRRD